MTANTKPRFTVLGSYTGRNAGDCAILENVVRGIVEACPGAECEVLTINPAFVRDMFADLPLKPVRTMPWDLSVETLGLPLVLSVLRSDVVVITSAILFDHKLWNPLYNYLSALVTAVGLAKMLGKRGVFYSVGVGPVYTWKGRKTIRWLLNKADMRFGADRIIDRAGHLRNHLDKVKRNLDARVRILKSQEEQSVRVLRELMGGV